MKKLVAFLESNVQWVALALGAVYVLWSVYAYVLSTPVQVTGVGPQPLGPGQVDEYIVQNAVTRLEGAISSRVVPEMPKPSYDRSFASMLALSDDKPATFSRWWLAAEPVTVDAERARAHVAAIGEPEVEALPVLAAATIKETRVGRSSIVDRAAVPVRNAQTGETTQPMKDITWITVRYEIPVPELTKAFEEAKIPAWARTTLFLDVQLLREELASDGATWTSATAVPPLLLSPDVTRPALPAAAAPMQTKQDFLQWAASNQSTILQPAFYEIASGDQWQVPGEPLPDEIAAQQQNFDPTREYTRDELMALTPEQRRLVAAERAKRDRGQVAQPRGGPAGGGFGEFGPRGGGGTRPPRGGFAPRDADRLDGALLAQLYQPGRNPYPGAAGEFGEFGPGFGTGFPGGFPGQFGQQAGFTATQFPIPNGEFDPSTLTETVLVGWAHDETVVPGKTYRYRIVYSIRSPIFNITNVAKDPKLTEVFAVASTPSGWTDPLRAAGATSFFLAANPRRNAESVRFEIFRWQDGAQRMQSFEVFPGDQIGGTVSDVDYATGWTLVDVRFNPATEETFALVLSPGGQLIRRDFRSDSASEGYRKLKQAISAARAAENPAALPGAIPQGGFGIQSLPPRGG